jgi:hypothetical protein
VKAKELHAWQEKANCKIGCYDSGVAGLYVVGVVKFLVLGKVTMTVTG